MARQILNHKTRQPTPQQAAADAVIAQMYGYYDAEAPRPQPVANDYQPPLAA